MNLAALFSGGKDSAYALYIAQQWGWQVKHLVSIVPVAHSMMFHHPNIGMTELLSEALDIPLVTKKSTEGEKAELGALRNALEGIENIEGVVTGAIVSDYQWSRINSVSEELDLKTFSPLWRKDSEMLLRDMIGAGFDIMIVGVSAEGLDSLWLGRKLNDVTLEDLREMKQRFGINPSGEGGEFETLVLDAPNFKKMLSIEDSHVDWRKNSGSLVIDKARLSDKK